MIPSTCECNGNANSVHFVRTYCGSVDLANHLDSGLKSARPVLVTKY